jgi:hypothetical protein
MDLSNALPDCATQWQGSSFLASATDSVLHTNELTGWVAFDVTSDVAAFLTGTPYYGWLIKLRRRRHATLRHSVALRAAGKAPLTWRPSLKTTPKVAGAQRGQCPVTDWVVHYLNGRQDIVARLDVLKHQGLGLSTVSLGELYEGVYYSRDPEGDERGLQEFLQGVTLVSLDLEQYFI